MNSRRVLLTGGRAPATLELARLFGRAGWRVQLAESLPLTLTSFSRYVERVHRVPAAHGPAYLPALRAVVAGQAIELVIPTCEEIFWISAGDLPTRVLCPPHAELLRLHSKWACLQWLQSLGLAVPRTVRVGSVAGLREALCDLSLEVCKPEYSRFASQTWLLPEDGTRLERHLRGGGGPTAERAWVVQQRLHGRALCSWSLVHQGRVVLHTCYPVEFTAGRASAIRYRNLEHRGVAAWVETVAQALGWTGMLAFDFIETAQGLYPLECNPRLTGGIHLFRSQPEAVVEAFVAGASGPQADSGAVQLGLPMFLYGLPQALRAGRLSAWWQAVRTGSEVAFRRDDPLPGWLCWLPLAALVAVALRHRVGLLEASTLDIEWNGSRR